MLQDYFRAFGLEAFSADIDPSQSSFSMMARTTILSENKLEEIQNQNSIGFKKGVNINILAPAALALNCIFP